MTPHDSFDEAVAAWSLGVLDPEDRTAFEAHLASCERCRQALTEYRRVNAAIGLAGEPQEPPADLKARTLARALTRPNVQQLSTARAVPAPFGRAQPQRMWPGNWLAAAAGIALIVSLGTYAASLRSQVSDLRQQVADASSSMRALRTELASVRRDSSRLVNTVNVLSAADMIRVDLRGQAGVERAAGRAYLSRSRGLLVSVEALPSLPPGRVYQLWLIAAGDRPVSGGVFAVDAAGASTLAAPLPAMTRPVKTVAVTVEVGPNGSPGPTSPIVLAGTAGD